MNEKSLLQCLPTGFFFFYSKHIISFLSQISSQQLNRMNLPSKCLANDLISTAPFLIKVIVLSSELLKYSSEWFFFSFSSSTFCIRLISLNYAFYSCSRISTQPFKVTLSCRSEFYPCGFSSPHPVLWASIYQSMVLRLPLGQAHLRHAVRDTPPPQEIYPGV